MPHVLLIFEYPTLNGGERSLLSVVPDLQSCGFRFSALAPGEGPLARALLAANVAVIPFVTLDSDGKRLKQDALRAVIAEEIKRVAPEVVHANSLAMGRLVGPVAVDRGVPSIGHLRDIIGLSKQAVEDLNRNSRLIAVSHATREHHVAQGVACDKLVVAYNGVDTERFRPRPATGYAHDELGVARDKLLIGSIGQLIVRKRHDALLRAATCVVRLHANAHFLIVGDRYSRKDESLDHESNLHRLASAPPLAGRVHIVPPREDIDRLLPELTLLVHPAHQEPLGRVLLEAGSCGVPILATDVGGTSEIFPPLSGAARLVPRDDTAVLSSAIMDLLADCELRRTMGAAAAARVREAFAVEHAARSLAVEYERLVGR